MSNSGFDAIPRAFELWLEITGSDPNRNFWQTYRDISLSSANEEIKEALELDKTNITVAFILDYYVRKYLNARTFTVQSILDDHTVLMEYLGKCKELYNILESGEILEAKVAFQDNVRESLRHYNVTNQEVFNMVDDIHELGLLRRDALKAMKNLQVHQFLHGEPDGARPIYYDTVYEYWNVNSLIKDMSTTKMGGILMSLIRDPLDTSSFFVLAFRNGGTLTVMTDQDREAHPMSKYMSRRPDRSFGDRIYRNHFPYTSVMDISFNYNDTHDSAHISNDSNELVSYQSKAAPRVKIADMLPDEVIWTSMMFSLIEEKFWKEGYKTPQLSYTSEMIRVNNALLAHASHLPAVMDQYQKLEAQPLTIDDVSLEATKDQWVYKPTKQHEWMAERYKHLVDIGMLNRITPYSEQEKLMLLSARDCEQLGLPAPEETLIAVKPSAVKAQLEALRGHYSQKDNLVKRSELEIRSLEATRFGSAEEVMNDYKWYGRYNFAKQINILARKEYDARREKVRTWFTEQVKANMPTLFKHIAQGSWKSITYDRDGFDMGKGTPEKREKLFIFHKSEDTGYYGNTTTLSKAGLLLHKGQEGYTSKFYCYINGAVASIYSRFKVTTPADIAFLAGCKMSELPDVLQHWQADERYYGNSNINRVDPLEWVVKNPWSEMSFDVAILLSKSAYNDICAKHNKTPRKFEVIKKEKSRW